MNDNLVLLKKIFSEILLCPDVELDINKPYVEMGVDSILSIQISKLIKLKFQIDIVPSDLYNFVSIKDLFEHLEEKRESLKNDPLKLKNSSFVNDQEKIAIIGLAGYFPQKNSVQEYWQALEEGKILTHSSKRWEKEGESKYVGGFLNDISAFDADFFNISPHEAKFMDPQHRLMLEISWQAFEDAGYTRQDLNRKKCNIYMTSLPGDYSSLLKENQNYTSFGFTGNTVSMLPGRISHYYNFKGESVYIDTACSSSLICTKKAESALRSQECDIAFVGASTIFSTPEFFNLADSSNLLSKNGHCYTFDSRAEGFVPAEAVIGIVLRRLTSAQKDHQQIYGIIEAIHSNHDGYTNGLMSPNGNSQKTLIQETYQKNNIDPSKIAYLEAHGTGTSIGDPLECNALVEAYESLSFANSQTFIGSSKANTGHALVASGLVSLVKVLQIFKHNLIPPQINFEKLNDQIRKNNFIINTEKVLWPDDKKLAAISAFGFSGTNVHMILSKADFKVIKSSTQGPWIFILTAKSQKSLNLLIDSFVPYIENLSEEFLSRLSYGLCKKRTHHQEKFMTLYHSKEDLLQSLKKHQSDGYPHFSLEKLKTNSEIKTDKWLQVFEHLQNNESNINWDKIFDHPETILSLPSYPFNKKNFWIAEDENIPVNDKQNFLFLSFDECFSKIKKQIHDILGHSEEKINITTPIHSLGIDSLVSLQILEPFKSKFSKIDPNILFNHDTLGEFVDDLTQFINQNPKKKSEQLSPKISLHQNSNLLEWKIFGNEEGIPLLLLSPLNTISDIWIQQIRYFTIRGYKIYIPHYPGHGKTPYFEFDFNRLTEIIWHEFQNLHKRSLPLNIIGWSLGGCLGLNLAYNYLSDSNKVILISTAARFEKDVFSQSPQLRADLNTKELYLKHLYQKDRNILESVSAGCSLDILRHYYESLQKFNFVSFLPKLKSQFLILCGGRDSVISQNETAIFNEIPFSKEKIFVEEGHFTPLTFPYELNLKVEEFMIYND